MRGEDLEQPGTWAVRPVGGAALGERRRTDRVVTMATARAETPSASLPESMRDWSKTRAASRFLETGAIAHEQIMPPHGMLTRQEGMQRARVVLVADTTDVNLSRQKAPEGFGPIGRGNTAQGFFVHTVLAMDADDQQVLRCVSQEPVVRHPAPTGETQAQRTRRVRASQVWERSIQAIGRVPDMQTWIAVGDRGRDMFTWWHTGERLGEDGVVRVAQDRRVVLDEEPASEDPEVPRLTTVARSLPTHGGRIVPIPAKRQRPARDAFVQIR